MQAVPLTVLNYILEGTDTFFVINRDATFYGILEKSHFLIKLS